MKSNHSTRRMLGPGLIFSGAAIGVSHLVQSTRAGALFGLGLVGVILLANLLKYPAFRFGVDYTHATGRSLLAGYRKISVWMVVAFIVLSISVAPVIMAAIAATTAGILTTIFGLSLSIPLLASLVLAGAAALLLAGGYSWLDRINGYLLAFLVLSTVAATALVLPRVEWVTLGDVSWAMDPAALLFIVALAGFMPNPTDVSVTISLWTIEAERGQSESERHSLAEVRTAFLAPYLLAVVMALCFCVMGAGVMHSSGVAPLDNAAGFAGQVINLYRETLGDVPALLASIAALSVMLSTVMAALDSYARSFAATYGEARGIEEQAQLRNAYAAGMVAIPAAASAVLFLLMQSFSTLVDLATSAAFVVGPVVALFNHLVVTRSNMPEEARPSAAMRMLNIAGIVVMAALAAMYFAHTLG